MNQTYYERRDLEDFPHIGEYAPELSAKFFDYYAAATRAGKLSERETGMRPSCTETTAPELAEATALSTM